MSKPAEAIPDQPVSETPARAPSAAPGNGEHTPRIYTAAELLELSQDDSHRYELINGELVRMTPAGFEHGNLTMALGARMRIFADDNGLGIVCAAETGFRIAADPDTVRAPDIGFVTANRIPEHDFPNRYFDGAPDLAVEIVSPNDTASRVQDKVQSWLAHGAQLVWVVEPTTQTLTVYRPDGSAQVLQKSDTLDGETLLPGFRFELARLFREAKPVAVEDPNPAAG